MQAAEEQPAKGLHVVGGGPLAAFHAGLDLGRFFLPVLRIRDHLDAPSSRGFNFNIGNQGTLRNSSDLRPATSHAVFL